MIFYIPTHLGENLKVMRTINHSQLGPIVQWLRYVPCTCKGFTLNNQPERVIGEPITPSTDEIRVRFPMGPLIFSVND
jgi:hypothetical protein